jgi:hypothetical protein
MNQAMLPTCKTINAIEGRLAASMDTGVHSPAYAVAKKIMIQVLYLDIIFKRGFSLPIRKK